jgi:hypothetical protein
MLLPSSDMMIIDSDGLGDDVKDGDGNDDLLNLSLRVRYKTVSKP